MVSRFETPLDEARDFPFVFDDQDVHGERFIPGSPYHKIPLQTKMPSDKSKLRSARRRIMKRRSKRATQDRR
jgi:hypothetical protein